MARIGSRRTAIDTLARRGITQKTGKTSTTESISGLLRQHTDRKLLIKDRDFGSAESFAARAAQRDAEILEERNPRKKRSIVVVQATGGGSRSSTSLSALALRRLQGKRSESGLFNVSEKDKRRRGVSRKKYARESHEELSVFDVEQIEETDTDKEDRLQKLKGASLDYFMRENSYYKGKTGGKDAQKTRDLVKKLKSLR